jgi:hypothetical protein
MQIRHGGVDHHELGGIGLPGQTDVRCVVQAVTPVVMDVAAHALTL